MAVILKCKMCGGDLNAPEGAKVVQCEFCGTQQTIPSVDDERKANLFNRANSLRSANEFDRAIGIYESIVNEFPEEAEAYWGLVLCKYGIEYVDDPVTHRKVPTCHRTSYESVFDDVNYKQAMSFADPVAKDVYRSEAEAVNEIQKGILSIAKNEKPFDVFICYKESDDLGRRTPDSVLAQDIYYELQRDGFKVFFSRITLEGKLGTAYEPYIFAALNSAKVMVVVGTRPEYYNAVWVKNEWSRFLDMMKKDKSKVIIPAYKDMDPYDLPDALSMFQAQDMGKLGFMQDLIRGITKLAGKDEEKPVQTVVQQTVAAPAAGSNVENLLKRGFMALEDGKWSEADSFFEQVLNENVEEPRAYLGKLMAELKYRTEKDFETGTICLDNYDNYKKAVRFGSDDMKAPLEEYRISGLYNNTLMQAQNAEKNEDAKNSIVILEKCVGVFSSLSGYKDADEQKQKCEHKISMYKKAVYEVACNYINTNECMSLDVLELARQSLEILGDYEDAASLLSNWKKIAADVQSYIAAYRLYASSKTAEDYKSAANTFKYLGDFRDSASMAENCNKRFEEIINAEREDVYQKVRANMDIDHIPYIEKNIEKLEKLGDYKDSVELLEKCKVKIQTINKNQKKKRIIAGCLVIAAIVFAIISILYNPVIKPAMDYNKAISLYKKGSYDEAISVFETLEDYKDSKKMIDEGSKVYVSELLDSGQIGAAWDLVSKGNRSDLLDSIVSKCDETIQQQIRDCEINGTVYFGKYDNELLEWTVLSKDDEKALLLCKKFIGMLPFSDMGGSNLSWEKSNIRSKLNDTAAADSFISSAFTTEGREFIMPASINNYDDARGYYTTYDNIFLLDESEANTYKAALSKYDGCWLRTTYSTQNTVSIYGNREVSQQRYFYVSEVVPAMYVKLK